jgi:hypothetical protein
MAGRFDHAGGVWDKVSKRYGKVGGIYQPVKKRFVKAGGIWQPSYSGIQFRMHMVVSSAANNDPAYHTGQLNPDGSGSFYILNTAVSEKSFDIYFTLKFLEQCTINFLSSSNPYAFEFNFSKANTYWQYSDEGAVSMYLLDPNDNYVDRIINYNTTQLFTITNNHFNAYSERPSNSVLTIPAGYSLGFGINGSLNADSARSGKIDCAWPSGGLKVLGVPITSIELY